MTRSFVKNPRGRAYTIPKRERFDRWISNCVDIETVLEYKQLHEKEIENKTQN